MRFGLIADIHGNAFALRAVFDALDRIGVDRTLCLGDIASPGPWPAEVIAALMERDIVCVLGNTDQWLLADAPDEVSDISFMNEANAWAVSQLSLDMVKWLETLPMQRSLQAESTTLHLWHGSPRSTTETISSLTPPDVLDSMLGDVVADVAACGHTHVQMLRRTASTTLVNPGSVGLGGTGPGTPDLPPPRPVSGAEFAVLETSMVGVSMSFHHIELDIDAMLDTVRATQMPHLSGWSRLWIS